MPKTQRQITKVTKDVHKTLDKDKATVRLLKKETKKDKIQRQSQRQRQRQRYKDTKIQRCKDWTKTQRYKDTKTKMSKDGPKDTKTQRY
jgi:hypothetical protein